MWKKIIFLRKIRTHKTQFQLLVKITMFKLNTVNICKKKWWQVIKDEFKEKLKKNGPCTRSVIEFTRSE